MTLLDEVRELLDRRPPPAEPPPRQGMTNRAEPGRTWFTITNQADADMAEVWIYDEIGYWGVSAGDFVSQLGAISARNMTVHINSPGGEVWDGLAIYHALRQHPANVTTVVDGAALSAASFIAQAGDERLTAAQSQWMIHDASGACYGNAAEMIVMAEVLDQMSGMIAEIYRDRGGLTVAKWRNLMRASAGAGTWFTADAAVEAGLADRVAAVVPVEAGPTARWDMAAYRPAAVQPDPPAPFVSEVTSTAAAAVTYAAVTYTAPPPRLAEPPAAVVPTAEPAAAGPTPALDLARMRTVVGQAVHVPFDLGKFRAAVTGVADAPPVADPPVRRAFPLTPARLPAAEPVPDPAAAGRASLAAAFAGIAADAPAPQRRTITAPAPAPLPAPTAAPAALPATTNRDRLRTAIGLVVNDTPAPPEPAPPPAAAPSDLGHPIDISAARRALRGAML